MVERNGTVLFPLVFYDGERETNVGNIGIHPVMDFKIFQARVGQMIGISYNNITIYFIDGKKSKLSTERRKILITGKVNFSLIARERDCFFLVVLKRSRRDRQRRPYQSDMVFGEYLPGRTTSLAPEKMLLLRRNQPELNDLQFSNYSYNDRFQDLQMQRENYINMLSNSSSNTNYGFMTGLNAGLDSDPFPKLEEIYAVPERTRVLCRECMDAKKGETFTFHCCVYDPVVEGFRSTAGPVRRPDKVPQ